MTVKLSKSLARIGLLSLITVATLYASDIMTHSQDLTQLDYKKMTTTQLQKEVEKHSTNGTLPFPMGLELINRWSNPK